MNKVQLQDLPWYSRVIKDGGPFNFYFVEDGVAICFNDDGKEFKLSPDTEVIFVSSMKEHDLSKMRK